MELQLARKWYTPAEVAMMLGFGLSKTKLLIAMREIRSVKVGARHADTTLDFTPLIEFARRTN